MYLELLAIGLPCEYESLIESIQQTIESKFAFRLPTEEYVPIKTKIKGRVVLTPAPHVAKRDYEAFLAYAHLITKVAKKFPEYYQSDLIDWGFSELWLVIKNHHVYKAGAVSLWLKSEMLREHTYKVYGTYRKPKKSAPIESYADVYKLDVPEPTPDLIEELMIDNRSEAAELLNIFNKLVELQITNAAWTREVTNTLERIKHILDELEVSDERLRKHLTLERDRHMEHLRYKRKTG